MTTAEESGQLHPAYGPCDGMGPNGQCAACCGITDGELARLRASGDEDLGLLVIELREYLKRKAPPRADALEAPRDDAAIRKELRMGHARIDECTGTEHTKGQSLYDRITFVLQRAEERRAEEEHLRKAVGAEMDVLRARANAAEHRQAAAEYRAQRIVLDRELLARAEKAEAALRAAALDAAPSSPKCPLCHEAEIVTCIEGEPGHENRWLMCWACKTSFSADLPLVADGGAVSRPRDENAEHED